MPDIDTARMRYRWANANDRRTHYEGCYDVHHNCAIAALCDELETARAKIAELETFLGALKMHDTTDEMLDDCLKGE